MCGQKPAEQLREVGNVAVKLLRAGIVVLIGAAGGFVDDEHRKGQRSQRRRIGFDAFGDVMIGNRLHVVHVEDRRIDAHEFV